MTNSINCTFKEINTGFTIYIKLNSNTKLCDIKNIIQTKISNAFGFDYDVYQILYVENSSNSLGPLIIPIDSNPNDIIQNIQSKAFYVEPFNKITQLNCLICGFDCIIKFNEYWKCEHHFKFCHNCVDEWKIQCIKKNINPSCPLCRKLI